MTELQSWCDAPSLTPGFARTVRGRAWALSLLGIALFAAASGLLLHRQREKSLHDAMCMWRTALTGDSTGDMVSRFDRYRASHPSLRGMAQWSTDSHEPGVHPEDSWLREAIRAAEARPGHVRWLSATLEGRKRTVGVVVFTLHSSRGPAGARLALAVEAPPLLASWLLSTLVFAMLHFFMVHAGAEVLVRWFNRRIAVPLREATSPHETPEAERNTETAVSADGGPLARAVEPYLRLSRELTRTRARLRQVERDSEARLREFQDGFHRRLRRAEDLAMIDPLTGLYNRAYLDRELEPLFAEQKSRNQDLSVVMIDVDHFKYHNDTRGHKAGDDVLRFIGELLRGATRPTDRCIRYGGDEFVLLLPGCTATSAEEIAGRIIRLFRQFASTLQSQRPPSMSAGVASLDARIASTGHELLGLADRHLYAAKRRGKNAVAVKA